MIKQGMFCTNEREMGACSEVHNNELNVSLLMSGNKLVKYKALYGPAESYLTNYDYINK